MSRARLVYRWATGEEFEVTIAVDENYPDAVAEAKAQAVAAFRDGMALLSPDEVAGE